MVIGGDGTINEVVDGAVLGQNVAFGFIPAGSGNDLCKGLGLPSNTRKSIRRALSDGRIEKLDYGVLSCGEGGEGCIRRFTGFPSPESDDMQHPDHYAEQHQEHKFLTHIEPFYFCKVSKLSVLALKWNR